MKKTTLLLVIAFLGTITFAQQVQTKEYATVHIRTFYQGNTVLNKKLGLSPSPRLCMPGQPCGLLYDQTGEKPVEFTQLSQILNYMAGFGWELLTSNTMPYEGDSGNTSSSNLLNTNEYIQILIFERVKATQTN